MWAGRTVTLFLASTDTAADVPRSGCLILEQTALLTCDVYIFQNLQ